MRGEVGLRMARAPPRMQASHKRRASVRPLVEPPLALTTLWIRIHRREWMTEEAARDHRRRSLLQDNPASG